MTRPIVDYGVGSIIRLAATVDEMKARRVLLITGRSSFEASGASRIVAPLERVAEVRRWAEFSPNIDMRDLSVGIGIAQDFGADAVVAIGGGSVMDMAKLICAYRDRRDLSELADAIRSGDDVASRSVRLLLAPTTSGSGSEATHFAVVYIGDDKFSVAGEGMLPDSVALDPTLALSGSPHQRATSGIDAVCQAIESLWALGATTRSRRYAQIALHLLMGNIESFTECPTARSARGMQLGSHLAGRAINISKTTAAHALSYGVTKRFGIDHGNAAALTLGQFIEAHARTDVALRPTADPSIFQSAMQTILQRLGAIDGPTARQNFRDLLQRLGLVSNLGDAGCTDDDIPALANSVNVQRLGNNPVVFTTEGLERVLAASLR